MTLTLTLTKTLPGSTWVPMPSLVLIGPAVRPAIARIQTDELNTHNAFYYVDVPHYRFLSRVRYINSHLTLTSNACQSWFFASKCFVCSCNKECYYLQPPNGAWINITTTTSTTTTITITSHADWYRQLGYCTRQTQKNRTKQNNKKCNRKTRKSCGSQRRQPGGYMSSVWSERFMKVQKQRPIVGPSLRHSEHRGRDSLIARWKVIYYAFRLVHQNALCNAGTGQSIDSDSYCDYDCLQNHAIQSNGHNWPWINSNCTRLWRTVHVRAGVLFTNEQRLNEIITYKTGTSRDIRSPPAHALYTRHSRTCQPFRL